MGGMWAHPLCMMHPHFFNYEKNFRIPRMVTSPKLVSLGVGAPLHPYLREMIELYDLAPLQLSPNSYKLVLTLFILYMDLNFPQPPMDEVSYFFSHQKSDHGYYYLVVNKQHNKKGFSSGKVSHEKGWKENFFYLYDVPRIRIQFNTEPSKGAP